MKPGTRVRCAYRGGHTGTVLSVDDPLAWKGSLAFPEGMPNRAAVKIHVRSLDLISRSKPVLWDFGRVYWDTELSEIQSN
jgi:hypothetical protein